MATYRQNVTQSVEPAQANWQTAARGIEMGGQAVVTALKGATALGEFAADAYVDRKIDKASDAGYEIGREFTADQLRSEYMTSNAAARDAAREASSLMSKRSIFEKAAMAGDGMDIGAHVSLNELDTKLERLVAASQGGMSPQELVDRTMVLTRNAITRFPGRADEIRRRVEAATGVLGADRYASNRYIQETLNPKESKKDTEEDLAVTFIKRIGPMGTWGDEQTLYKMYKTEPERFDSVRREVNEVQGYKTTAEALENKTKAENLTGDVAATRSIPTYRAMFDSNLKATVFTKAFNEESQELQGVLELLKAGKTPETDADAFSAYVNMHNAKVGAAALEAKNLTLESIRNYLETTNKFATPAARKEMEQAIETDYNNAVAAYKPDSVVGLVAAARIMKTYSKESLQTKLQLRDLAVKELAATNNSDLSKQYWAGGDSREKLKREYPDYYKHIDERANIILKGGVTSQQIGEDAVKLSAITNMVKSAEKGEGVEVAAGAAPEQQRVANTVVINNAHKALDNAVKSGTMLPVDRNTLQSAFILQIGKGADPRVLAQDYKKIFNNVSQLPNEDQAVIKSSASKASSEAVLSVTGLRQTLEAKYKTEIKLGVNDAGQIVIVDPRLQDPDESNAYIMARDEFKKKAMPIISNLVHGRAALTGEPLNQIAAEYAYHIGFDEPYRGFFSLEGKPVEAKPTTPAAAPAKAVTSNNDQWWLK
jgi:hypothetical protein